ncbi:hypothetical protein [Deinococcus sp. Marseille-Q6407]|uniref:hypothetical protein n=1 Tax=Deinococcus sp. Marseille-Q6407 TaxID=2969223 RepID=UPI0021BE228E|nr:hypothetical protein [Deinococcus sp. Marseille-Q6407]
MGDLNPAELLPAVQTSGFAGILIALGVAASYLITAWRGGKVSVQKEHDMEKWLASLERRLSKTERTVTALKDLVHSYRFQRDDARIYARELELRYSHAPQRAWEPDPKWPDEEEDSA